MRFVFSFCSSCHLFLCLFSLQRFFVLDNGILKYSKSPIDVSNPDYNLEAETEQPGLTSALLGSDSAETSATWLTMFIVFQSS